MGKDQAVAELHADEIWQTLRTDPAQLAVQTQQLWDQSGLVAAQLAQSVMANATLQAASRIILKI